MNYIFFWISIFISWIIRFLLNVINVIILNTKMAKKCMKGFLFAQGAKKKASAKRQSPPQGIKVGSYLLVSKKAKKKYHFQFCLLCLLVEDDQDELLHASGPANEGQ